MTSRRFSLVVLLLFGLPCCARPTNPVQTLRLHKSEVVSLAWSGDGKTVASGDKAGVVVLCDARTGKTRLRLKYGQAISALAFSPDGKTLAVGRGREIRLLNSRTGAPVRILKLESSAGKDLSFSADGRELMGTEGSLQKGDRIFAVSVWQLPSGRRMRHWTRAQVDVVIGADLAPDGKTVALVMDGPIEVWSVDTGQRLRKWQDNTGEGDAYFGTLSFAPDARFVAGGGSFMEGPGHFVVWDIKGHTGWFATFQDYVSTLAFSPHNRLLAVGTEYDTTYVDKPRAPGGDVFLYDLKTHKRTFALQGHKDGVNIVAWSPDGKRLVSGSSDHTIKIWQLTQ